MKLRNIAYGYCYTDGKIVVQHQDAQIVREIFSRYLQGESLRQITEWLNNRNVEYKPGVIGWNKARIMRMLEDKRYLGDEKHPTIVEQTVYDKAQRLKTSKNDQQETDRTSDIYQIGTMIRCPICNSPMKRRVDKRQVTSTKWVCKNATCKTLICKTDESLLSDITETLNELIANPHIICIPTEKESEPSIELIRRNNEIARLFDSPPIDREVARAKMLEYASLKYQETDSAVSIAKRLKDIFIAFIPLQAFCPHLFDRTVDEIRLHTDGTVGIILTNKQEIKKGGQNGTS